MLRRGFTIVEIMLVLFLIGLVSAGVVQTFVFPSISPAKKAAQNFMTLFSHLKDRALIEGRMMGVLITPSGYQFMQYHSGQWEPVTATRLAAQSSVPKQVQMILLPVSSIWQKEDILELEHHRLTLNDIELELKKEEKKKTPQIRYTPFEPAMPFALQFNSPEKHTCWAVNMTSDGELSLDNCDE